MTDPEDCDGPVRIFEFADIVSPPDHEEAPVVVGGQAVNLWSEYYLARGMDSLSGYMPFTSKDLDLIGPAGLLERLHHLFSGKLTLAEPRGPVLGRLDILRENGSRLKIEVLNRVRGLEIKDLSKTMDLKIGESSARVLMPHLILKAKIENSAMISQKGRNDVKHVSMMVLCVQSFLEEFANHVGEGRISPRALVNVLEEVHGIISSSVAEKAKKQWGFAFDTVWPLDALRAIVEPKIDRWLAHRFP